MWFGAVNTSQWKVYPRVCGVDTRSQTDDLVGLGFIPACAG